VSTWYKLTDKTRLGAWIAVAGTLVTIGGNILLIPVLGVMGSAMSALACYLLMCILSYLQGQKYFPIPYNISRMALWIGMALFIYYLMNLIQTFLNERLPVILVANTLLIAIYLLLVFRFEKSLLQQLKRQI
jgi:peptidoglycan biosynthesis protein MviN/MurJ (putative lipid II flippase)